MSKPKTWKVHPSKKWPGWLTVIGPHDEDFKQAIKSSFRHPVERQWSSSLGAWIVHESRHDDLLALIDEHTETPLADIDDLLRQAKLAANDVHRRIYTAGASHAAIQDDFAKVMDALTLMMMRRGVSVEHPPADAPIRTGLDGARALLGRAQDLGEVVTASVSEDLAESLSLGLEVFGELAPATTGDLVAVRFDSDGARCVFVGAVMKVG